jgi:hypothetical protein
MIIVQKISVLEKIEDKENIYSLNKVKILNLIFY